MGVARLFLKAIVIASVVVTASATPYVTPTTTEPCPSLPPCTKSTSSSSCQTLQNKDRPGYDFKNVTAAVTSCGDLCKVEKSCKTWAWSTHASGTCWLKNVVGPLIDLPGVVTTACTYYHDNVPASLPSSSCSLEHGIDLTGDGIGNLPAASANLCCDICKNADKCKAFSWSNYNGGTCWLKKNAGQKITKAGIVSSVGVKADSKDTCALEFNTDFDGANIGNQPAKDAGDCCSKCKATKNCKAFTWTNYQSGTCWMKSAKGNVIVKSGAVSAKVN